MADLLASLETKYQLPSGLLNAVMKQESGGNVNAVSPKGAQGAFQFMPATAKQYGVDTSDLNSSADGAARMYSDLLKAHNGDLDKALASYNYGQGNVAKHGMDNLPKETQDYIAKVKAKMPTQANDDFDLSSAKPTQANDDFDLSSAKPVAQKLIVENTKNNIVNKPLSTTSDGLKLMQNASIGSENTTVKDFAGGLVRGAGSIGSTILLPADMINQKLRGDDFFSMKDNNERRQKIDDGLSSLGIDTKSGGYKGGKLISEIAGTAGAGDVLAASKLVTNPIVLNSLKSGGMKLDGTTGSVAKDLALRSVGGAAVSGTAGAMVDPSKAGEAAGIGAVIPVGGAAVAKVSKAIGSSLNVSTAVKDLAIKAKKLGIDIPLDRLTNSNPLNALASTLNYVPFSGRAATEAKMSSQLNKALSNTFGQDTTNITKGLRDASIDLGQKFDNVLKNNKVNVTDNFLNSMSDIENTASKELGNDSFKPIKNQLNEILAKTDSNNQIDGKAAYNIKKSLDRISYGSGNEAYHAKELKKSLMDALNDSLTPQAASDFAKTRQQYGNMLSLENLAKNGAEGDISVARLANLKNINNPQLQEIADIAAQFVKPREGAHGAAQRAVTGGIAGYLGGLKTLGVSVAASRGANMALNSNLLKNKLLTNKKSNLLEALKKPQLLTTAGALSAQ